MSADLAKEGDLIGIPIRLTVGAKSLAEGNVELSLRRDRVKQMVPVAEAVALAATMLAASTSGNS